MNPIGKIEDRTYIDFIAWSDGHGHCYRYHGTSSQVKISLAPALIDNIDRAANRFYHVSIRFTDARPPIERLVKYYFIIKLLQQNHIDVSAIEWERGDARPDIIPRPRPKKGPDKTNMWYLVVFQYGNLVKPVMSRSVERAWHTIYADSPVELEFIGSIPCTQKQYMGILDLLSPARHHGDWFLITDEFREMISSLDLTKNVA